MAVVSAGADIAVDMAIVAGASLLQEIGQDPAKRIPLGMPEMELPEELLERQSFPARAAQRGEKGIGIDIHEGSFLAPVASRRQKGDVRGVKGSVVLQPSLRPS